MNRLPLAELADRPFDVVVIGAGINGAGAAQQIAARGYRVLVIDQGDFAGGATGRSSRILHCGLRHLAPGKSAWEFVRHPSRFWHACANARASMIARRQISETMQPLVRPFRFYFPIYRDGPYAPWQVDAAFRLLRTLGPRDPALDYARFMGDFMDSVPFSRWLRDREKLRGVAVFRDYQFLSAERLVVDTLRDAARMGAVVRNYTSCDAASRRGDHWVLDLSDRGGSGESAQVSVRVVINVGGPWGDRVSHRLTATGCRRAVGLKGIHIAVRLPEELRNDGMMAINSIDEPMYCLPWNGMHYIGPTRTPYDGDLDEVIATSDEVDWVLQEANQVFPDFRLSRSDVLYTWAGIQPVTRDPHQAKGTRAIKIHDLASEGCPNVLMLTGGPIMTFRIIGNKITDAVAKRIAPTAESQSVCYDASDVTRRLDYLSPTDPSTVCQSDVLQQIACEEQTLNLADLYLRRTALGWADDQGRSNIEAGAEAIADKLGWDESRRQAEIRDYLKYIDCYFPRYA